MRVRPALVALGIVAALAGCGGPTAARPAAGVSSSGSPAAGASAPPSTQQLAAGTAPKQAFQVATRELGLKRGGDRPLRTVVTYPRGSGRFPVVVFSHGLTGTPEGYQRIINRIASAG